MSEVPEYQKAEPAQSAPADHAMPMTPLPTPPVKRPSGVGTMILGFVVILGVLLGIGFFIGRSTAPAAASTPAASSGPSASCLTAISEARKVFDLSSDALGLTSKSLLLVPDVMTAMQDGDTATIDDATTTLTGYSSQIQDDTAQLKALDFTGPAAACEAGN